jgi:hypothetical protein
LSSSIDIFFGVAILMANLFTELFMGTHEDIPGADGGLNDTDVRDGYRDEENIWMDSGCLPIDEAAEAIQSLGDEIRNNKIKAEARGRIIYNTNIALMHTVNGPMKELLRRVLRAALFASNNISED